MASQHHGTSSTTLILIVVNKKTWFSARFINTELIVKLLINMGGCGKSLENEGIARGTIYVGIRIWTKYSFFVKPTVGTYNRAFREPRKSRRSLVLGVDYMPFD